MKTKETRGSRMKLWRHIKTKTISVSKVNGEGIHIKQKMNLPIKGSFSKCKRTCSLSAGLFIFTKEIL